MIRLGLSPADRVILYGSDTLVGRTVVLALKSLLEDYLPGLAVSAKTIDGLQVHDGETFRRRGVVNFVKELGDDIERFGLESCILNPLGGYKALVPYSVLVAMIRGIQSCYIFEGADAVLSLPSLPLDFPPSLLEAVSLLCEKIDRETSIEAREFDRLLGQSPVGRDYAAILFEREGGHYTLSAVGMLLWQTLRERRPLVPYVSHAAIQELCELARRENCHPFEFLNRVCRSADQFESKKHGNAGAGLTWLKPGNTADRYLVSVEEGWRLLVWRAVAHDDYDRLSDKRALGAELRARSTALSPFVRLDFFSL